jgi:hypothetical protein
MRFNSKQREKPYQALNRLEPWLIPKGIHSTGVAWLSQVRVVRYLVKSFNERNPQIVLYVSV